MNYYYFSLWGWFILRGQSAVQPYLAGHRWSAIFAIVLLSADAPPYPATRSKKVPVGTIFRHSCRPPIFCLVFEQRFGNKPKPASYIRFRFTFTLHGFCPRPTKKKRGTFSYGGIGKPPTFCRRFESALPTTQRPPSTRPTGQDAVR